MRDTDQNDTPRAQSVKSGPTGFVAEGNESNQSRDPTPDGTGAWDAGTIDMNDTNDTTADDARTDVMDSQKPQDTLNATVEVDTEPLKKQLNKQLTTRAKQKQSTKKVPILGLAMGIMSTAGMMLTSGRYLVGGALVVSAMAFITLYEVYQIKELPPMVDEEMVIDTIEHLISEVRSRK